ncbi:MAG: hypothetical protein ABSD73_12265 [Candidatus Bathyarchaeia archaeon]
MSKQVVLALVVLFAVLGLAVYPKAYAWDSSPQITSSLDGSGNTILTIQFNFSEMSDPPTGSHHPIGFQVRTSTDGSSWTELSPIQISLIPATTIFTETENIGHVSGTIQVQARLDCNIHGWSSWGPDPAIPVPEFPFGMVTVTSMLFLAGGLLVFRRKHLAYPA